MTVTYPTALARYTHAPEWNESQKRVLGKIVDALWDDLGEEETKKFLNNVKGTGASEEELTAFARRRATDCGDFAFMVASKVSTGPPHDLKGFELLLDVYGSRTGCLALTGKRGPIWRLDNETIRDIFKGFFSSKLPIFREQGKVWKLLLGVICMGTAAGLDESVNWKAMQYRTKVDVGAMRKHVAALGEHFDFSTCRVKITPQPEPATDTPLPQEVIVDCVIVGSGPGGSMMAAELTEAGFTVGLLDYSRWESLEEQSTLEAAAYRKHYQEAGNFFNEGRTMNILAANAFGGGAAVNWSCCLPPPDNVRQEWARDYGVEWVAGAEMTDSIEQARQRLRMHTDGIELNAANQVLMRGCQRLGYQAEVAAQQGYAPKSPDDGGLCSAAWKQGSGQGMHGSALKDAAKTGRLFLLDGATAHKVLRDQSGAACAVAASSFDGKSSRELVVRARCVVAAGGALQTPLLLKRSGLKNPHIGKHLKLHPALTIWGLFDEPIKFYEGAPMTTVSRVVENQDGKGYGGKIWVPNYHPVSWCALQSWHGVREFKESIALFPNAAPLISLARDTGEGKVWEDMKNRTRVTYNICQVDIDHLQTATDHAARILAAAGARKLYGAHNTVEALALEPRDEAKVKEPRPELEAWLAQQREYGMPECGIALGSAHQMGTCRMASTAKMGAAKPTGELWEVDGLFVADTSAFCTASGVNPMWTVTAISHRVAQNVKKYLKDNTGLRHPCPHGLREHLRERAHGCMHAGQDTVHVPTKDRATQRHRTAASRVSEGSEDSKAEKRKTLGRMLGCGSKKTGYPSEPEKVSPATPPTAPTALETA